MPSDETKLTLRQMEVLQFAAGEGCRGAAYSTGSNCGGARRRMFWRLAERGLLEPRPPWPITEAGRAVVAARRSSSAS